MSWACASTPGVDGSSGVATMSASSDRARAEEDDLAGEVGEVGAGLEHLPGGNRCAAGRTSRTRRATWPSAWSGTTTSPSLIESIDLAFAGGAAVGGRSISPHSPVAPCATRSVSRARLGWSWPLTSSSKGTRRTTRSLSGSQLRKPKPAGRVREFGDRRQHAVEVGPTKSVGGSPTKEKPALVVRARLRAVVGRRQKRRRATTGRP